MFCSSTLGERVPVSPELERVAWPVALQVDAYGVRIGIRASEPELLSALRRVVPPGASLAELGSAATMYSLVVTGTRYVLFADARHVAESQSLDEMLALLESELHFQIAVEARTRLFVHAGVVGWHGGAVLIPGRTHSGKSSLVAALVRAGATYYSDEYAVLDDHGQVHPFARALGLRDQAGRTHRVAPNTIGVVGEGPLPVVLVVATRHVGGALWRPAPMSPGETVLALFDNTLAARARPADALRILATVARGATGVRGDRGEVTDVVERILTFRHTRSGAGLLTLTRIG